MEEGQTVEATGVPIEITVRVGPGIIEERLPVGSAAGLFVVDGCVHKLTLVASTQVMALFAIAYARATAAAGGQQGEGQGEDAEAPLRLDA